MLLDPRWRRWARDGVHRVTPMPGAREALAGIRALGVTIVFNTNRDADCTERARRDLAASPGIAALWGNGWFVMPNPVYGTALRGSADDIFPKDEQWRDPGAVVPKEQHP